MATLVPQLEEAKPVDVDRHLRPLLSPLGDAVNGRSCVATVALESHPSIGIAAVALAFTLAGGGRGPSAHALISPSCPFKAQIGI